MYMQLNQNYKCSMCNNQMPPKNVTRGNQIIIRCRNCGHEKVTAEISVSDNSGEYTRAYNIETPKETTY